MNATFPERLKEVRESRSMTQDELGEMVGINRVAISRYESGLVKPNSKRVAELAAALGVTMDYLMGGNPSQDKQEQDEVWLMRERLRRDPDYRKLFDAVRKASPEHLRAATAMLNSLINED